MPRGGLSTSRHCSCNDAAHATPSGPGRTCPKATYRFPVTAVPTTRHLLLHKACLALVHAPTQRIDFPSPLLLLLRAPLMPRGNVSSSGHRCANDAALATSSGRVHAPTQCRLPGTLSINYITVYTYFLPTSCRYMPQGNITTSRDRTSSPSGIRTCPKRMYRLPVTGVATTWHLLTIRCVLRLPQHCTCPKSTYGALCAPKTALDSRFTEDGTRHGSFNT
ncbi:hypothetical protein B0H34DRAFT_202757 [Crassisporium funariophilum]|nr:hypothetical protein B0H34DRAFT_202757 [Crassisporium funariophilum]